MLEMLWGLHSSGLTLYNTGLKQLQPDTGMFASILVHYQSQ